MSETTCNQETLLAIEVEPSSDDLAENLAIYRRLTARQKAAIAADLKRKVQREIAEERQASRQRAARRPHSAGPLSQAKNALLVFMQFSWSIIDYIQAGRIVHSMHIADRH